MSVKLSDLGDDMLAFIKARRKQGLEVRMSDVGKAFPAIDVVENVRQLERAGFIKTKGFRGMRIELV
jgi:hypothetical protein